jgi:hypothetical protein
MNKNQLKYNKADSVIRSLTDEQREELSFFVQDIRESQANISSMADSFQAKQKCAECNGACCIVTIEDEIEEVDYSVMIMGAAPEQRAKIQDCLDKDNYPYCCFKDKEGCVIPGDIRPAVCKSFYCADVPELKKIMDMRRISVYEQYLLVHKKIKEMGSDIGCDHIKRYNQCA